jgi:hypothetical protein
VLPAAPEDVVRIPTRISRLALVVALGVALLFPADLLAQRRSSGRQAVVVSGGYSRPYYYRPYYRPYYAPYWGLGFGYGWYSPFYYGFYGQYPYPYPYYYGPWGYDFTGSARLQVTPRNAQVFIDGYFVGVVDEFDGNLQRLHVEPGEHELQLYLDGHQTFTQKVLLVRGRTLKIVHTMQPLGPGETAQPVSKPDESMRAESATRGPSRQAAPPREEEPVPFGSLLLRVRPADAEILVDGEPWDAPPGEDQFVIELSEGTHRVEVRKKGFQTYSTTVRVRRGDTVRVNVSLTPGGSLTGVL